MKMRPVVELSYLDEDSQRDLVDAIDEEVCTPTHAQATGKELVINGETITATTTFIPTEPSGIATVEFTFDSKYITEDTDIVVFENLYKDGKELAVHADIEDKGQTVKIRVPEIQTTATVDGEKEICATEVFTLTDTVEYNTKLQLLLPMHLYQL